MSRTETSRTSYSFDDTTMMVTRYTDGTTDVEVFDHELPMTAYSQDEGTVRAGYWACRVYSGQHLGKHVAMYSADRATGPGLEPELSAWWQDRIRWFLCQTLTRGTAVAA
jgi:hypothetical protein